MIFVLESYKKNRRAKIEAWEKARDEYLGNNRYYSRGDYAARYPRPGISWGRLVAVLPFLLVPLMVGGVLTALIKSAPTGAEVDKSASNPHGCHVIVNKGDKVAVQGGDFDGSEGIIVDENDSCYVHLTLTKSTYTREYCLKNSSPGYCDKTKENGSILTVDNSKNIIKL